MNKLVSKNPVLRFKLGRKIVKAENGNVLRYNTLYSGKNGNSYILDPDRGWIMRRNGITSFVTSPVRIHLNGSNYLINGKNTSFIKPVDTTTKSKNTGSAGGTINNVWLKGYKHDEVKDVRAMLNELIKLGLLKGNLKNGTGADGKWGKNTEAAYLTYLNLKNIPTYTKAELTDNTPATPTILEEPILQNDFASQKSAGYPSSLSRGEQLLNSITLRPEFKYGYSNYRNFNPIKLDLKPMFKQGGQLISRNPVKRFKSRTII